MLISNLLISDFQLNMIFQNKFPFRIIFNLNFLGKFLVFILFFSLVSPVRIHAQSPKDQARIDSIFTAISKMPDDTNKVNYIIKIYDDYLYLFNLPESYNKLKYACKISKELNFDKGIYNAYGFMAGYCWRTCNNEFSLANRFKALEVAERMKDSTRINVQWMGMAQAYHSLGNEKLALEYYFRAKPFLELSGDSMRISKLYSFLSWSYCSLGKDSVALVYALRGLEIRRAMKYEDGVVASTITVRAIYMGRKWYAKALECDKEVLALQTKHNNQEGIASCYIAFGEIDEKLNKPDSALLNYAIAQDIILKTNAKYLLKDLYSHLSSAYELKGDIVTSYKYFKLYVKLNDSLAAAGASVIKERTNEIYDLESKNAEIDLKEKDIESKRKSLIGLVLILSITCALGIIIFFGYRQKKRIAIDLSFQKKVVEEKNLDITNSIVYAKRIQQAILPSIPEIKKALPDSFILYHPKDIVSGDFFWFTETKDSFYIAAVDCTGHGVPGALMSMVGFNFLGEIILEMKTGDTSEILNLLHRKVLFALNKDFSSHDLKDGMDIALLRIFKNKNEIEFSGAVSPLYIIENGNLKVIKGDIYSIGGIKDVEAESFSVYRETVSKGTSIYLFSDGFADQFGGPFGKKFKYKQMRELFISFANLPMEEQKTKLNESFKSWKSNLEQVDDVLVIGVKI